MRIRIKARDSKVYSGEQIAQYMIDITPREEKPDFFANIARKHKFELKKIPMSELIDKYIGGDVGVMEYIEADEDRYEYANEVEPSSSDLYYPIVIADGELLDGYNRVLQHIRQDIDYIDAYVSI